MIIEFIGVPGAGKTTLHEKLAQALREAGCRVTLATGNGEAALGRLGGLRRARYYVAASWRWRKALFMSIRLLLKSTRPWPQKLFAFRLLVVALGRYQMAGRLEDAGIVLMDEGFLQRCFMVLVDGPTEIKPDVVSRLVTAGPHGHVAIYVKTAPEKALHRLSGRERGLPTRLQRLSKHDLLATFRSSDDLLGRIVQMVSNDTERPVRVIAMESEDLGSHPEDPPDRRASSKVGRAGVRALTAELRRQGHEAERVGYRVVRATDAPEDPSAGHSWSREWSANDGS